MRKRDSSATGKPPQEWNRFFGMITRGFVENFSLALNRNSWVIYLALATFYNRKQKRSFPPPERLYAVVPLDRSARSRALSPLRKLGLVEIWGERKGRRRRRFFRLLHVDESGRHVADRQQPTHEELSILQKTGKLPKHLEWVRNSYLKGVGEHGFS